MEIAYNFPAISILLCLFCGIISSVVSKKVARIINFLLIVVNIVLSTMALLYCAESQASFVYVMGKFSAPWGNEIRFGVLECLMALFFCVVMLLSLLGGQYKIDVEVPEDKGHLYYVLVDLLLSSLLALVYTNDMFTAYVFVEINTIAACGLIMIRGNGRTIAAAVRYMVMSLIGSGLLLMGTCVLYDITGQLLMSNMKEAVMEVWKYEQYQYPLALAITLISVGLAIKSALFPFHSWLPDAYGYSTISSSAILSSLVSKGYIFLLIKIIYRVIGFGIYAQSHIMNVFYAFGLAAMIFGSIQAIRQSDIRRMIAYSSVAQIGYIYMGFGLATSFGMEASIYHILSHGATKSLLFIAAIGLTDVSGFSRNFKDLTGAGYRNVIAGIAFSVGALSMVGMPLFSGFISKLLFAEAAINVKGKAIPVLIVLAISVILNAVYFMKTVVRIYTPVENDQIKSQAQPFKANVLYGLTLIGFIVLNIVLGVNSDPFVSIIQSGLSVLG